MTKDKTPETVEELYKRHSIKNCEPTLTGWYNTSKGMLYWFSANRVFSCRSDYVSEEYPEFWYQPDLQTSLLQKDNGAKQQLLDEMAATLKLCKYYFEALEDEGIINKALTYGINSKLLKYQNQKEGK